MTAENVPASLRQVAEVRTLQLVGRQCHLVRDHYRALEASEVT